MDATDNLSVEQVAGVGKVPTEGAPESSEAPMEQRASSEPVFVSSNKENDESNGATASTELGDEGSMDCLALDHPQLDENSKPRKSHNEELDRSKAISPLNAESKFA